MVMVYLVQNLKLGTMTLKHRIIPIILFDGHYCVQTTQFKQPARRIGPINQYVNNIAKRNVDELIIIDINATKEKRRPYFDKIKEFTANQFCPVTYGGGIKSLEDIDVLIKYCGVDKVAIKTNFALIDNAAKKYGTQAIVYAMDCWKHHSNGSFFIHELPRKFIPGKWAKVIEKCHAGEILLTSMSHQGLMKGYSSHLIWQVANSIGIPVIANGGCGDKNHMIEAIKCGASAAASSTMFCLRETTPIDCARALQEAGLPARVSGTASALDASQRPGIPRPEGVA